MLELALHFGDGPLLMESIATNQDLSRKYLHTLLTRLKGAGLVRSVRGSGGGYILARDPAEIRISEIVRVLEGSLTIVDCVADGDFCEKSTSCATRDLWRELTRTIEDFLGCITLADLAARQKEKESGSPMYFI
jgi:Rrf2 family protein